MGFDQRFTIGLIAWIVALVAVLLACIAAFATPGLGAARIVALAIVAATFAGLWRHITRTNRTVARFLEALKFGDTAFQFDAKGGAGFDELGGALNEVLARFRADQDRIAGELRYLDALVDDMPVAVLTVDAAGHVTLANKAARRLFTSEHGKLPEDFAVYGATFARRLANDSQQEELLILTIAGRPQRMLVRTATLERLGQRTRAISVQPIQGTLDAVEMAAQTDLVRVLTHEILNSLTPVTSLAATAADLLGDPDLSADPRVGDARVAVETLARRAQGLSNFIEAYRAVAQTPQIKRQGFAACPWIDELARIFATKAFEVPLRVAIIPETLALDADPDLLAQVVINLMQNAAQAMQATEQPQLTLRLTGDRHSVAIEIEDNGPGVPEGLRQDVFLPFFTTRATGTGVGLNLARQIVIAHGGTIDVTDAPDGGALFRIVL
ncbi:sensor histidine kinase [Sphingomonas psychrotolerans]|uniref:histidine kinase n=1 Tax=Sphingomonas psychrotolerans TaxID=1327635 RepID=A0A2K8MDQ1_9SPHN|nr:ATP-binding protein [Sphingomonas psychrotolerans]ATY32018.1 ATP-binding protein [Sphingomonas psychrotolerans]